MGAAMAQAGAVDTGWGWEAGISGGAPALGPTHIPRCKYDARGGVGGAARRVVADHGSRRVGSWCRSCETEGRTGGGGKSSGAGVLASAALFRETLR